MIPVVARATAATPGHPPTAVDYLKKILELSPAPEYRRFGSPGMANIEAFEREGIIENVRANEATFRQMLESLRDLPIVGDVRGAGYFHAIELVKDRDTKQSFSSEESETLLRGYLSGELFRRGLICRADDRGDPVVQLSPPLIAGPEHFEEIEGVLRPVLEEASRRMLHSK